MSEVNGNFVIQKDDKINVLEDDEMSRIVNIIASHHPECTSVYDDYIGWDEMGMAELFGECYGETIRYAPENQMWYTYTDGLWRQDKGALQINEMGKRFVRLLYLYGQTITDKDKQAEWVKFVGRAGDRRFRERMLKDAQSICPISILQFDADPYLINCRNGVYSLRDYTFREHRCEDYMTMQTAFDYGVRAKQCKRWEQFLREVCQDDKDKIDYLQRALGYSMLGRANEECMFILYGKTTRNGKSTMLNTIYHLLGDYAAVAPVSLICVTKQVNDGSAANPMLAALKGKRFVTMSESNQYGHMDEEAIKTYTGGEDITTRGLYSAPITYTPQFTLWLSCNDLPNVGDRSLFSSGRLNVIEFNRHFDKSEQDKNLKVEFEEQDAMRGIFAWMIEGYKKYLKYGLEMTENLQNVVDAYAEDQDVILNFLRDRCDMDEGNRVKAKSLYDNYKIWAKSNGYHVLPAKTFCKQVESHADWVLEVTRPHNTKQYRGLKIRDA